MMETNKTYVKESLEAFEIEGKSGTIFRNTFRRRWLLKSNNPKQFEMGDAHGHAECRGMIACGHAECRGMIACGHAECRGMIACGPNRNPSAMKEFRKVELEKLFTGKLGSIPKQNANVYELLESIRSVFAK